MPTAVCVRVRNRGCAQVGAGSANPALSTGKGVSQVVVFVSRECSISSMCATSRWRELSMHLSRRQQA